MLEVLQGVIRPFLSYGRQRTPDDLRLTGNESLASSQVEGEGDEMTRAGKRFTFGFTTGVTGIAPVQAIPSTAAQWLLYNPTANPNTIFIDEIGLMLVSGTGGATAGLILLGATVWGSYLPSTLPTVNVTDVTTAPCGLYSHTSQLIIQQTQTLATAPVSLRLLASGTNGVASPTVLTQAIMNNDVKGKIAIPPGQGLALYACGGAGTSPLYCPVGTYREYVSGTE